MSRRERPNGKGAVSPSPMRSHDGCAISAQKARGRSGEPLTVLSSLRVVRRAVDSMVPARKPGGSGSRLLAHDLVALGDPRIVAARKVGDVCHSLCLKEA